MRKHYTESRKREISYIQCSSIGHILRRNCTLKHILAGKIELSMKVTERKGRKRKQVLGDFKERREYWKLKEEAFDRTLW
jgi:hypothetical protein